MPRRGAPSGVGVREEPPSAVAAHAAVPCAFLVASRISLDGLEPPPTAGPPRLREDPVARPWSKDYDLGDEPVSRVGERWDTSRWAVLGAFRGTRRVGGALVAWRTPAVDLLEGRDDLALLWDLRVHPDHRREGIASLLFRRVVAWAHARACAELRVETQDVNAAACRFYAAQGCRLVSVERGAYPAWPDEAKLLWTLALGPPGASISLSARAGGGS